MSRHQTASIHPSPEIATAPNRLGTLMSALKQDMDHGLRSTVIVTLSVLFYLLSTNLKIN
jgi:hypothetical protein